VAKPHATEGKPDDLVPVQVKMPLWLKKRALARARERAQDLSAYIKWLIVTEAGELKK
jgi:hypothetical protein